ncbi:hypothetical protein, partial [Alicyclobacillus suci]|uniref:hypothetical protein n=1 Tax=Alicyclobacillus suci TaxID=2816080 RepID=UPI001A9062C8
MKQCNHTRSQFARKSSTIHTRYDFEDIEQDPLLKLKLDVPKLPDTTLLYKDLKRLGSDAGIKAIRSAHRQILR